MKKAFGWIVSILLFMLAIFMLTDIGDAKSIMTRYAELTPQNTSGLSKTLNFLRTYVDMTGDTKIAINMGIPEDEANKIIGGETETETGNETETETTTETETGGGGTVGDGDLGAAKAIAATFKHWDHNSSNKRCLHNCTGYDNWCYSQGPSNRCGKGCKYCSLDGQIAATCNGKSVKAHRRDCSAFVTAYLFAVGVTADNMNRGSSHFVSGNVPGFTNTLSTDKTWGTCQLYDVIARHGHVAIVVKIDDNNVYLADAGSTDAISSTAANGYASKRVYSKSDKLAKFGWGKSKDVYICRKR